MLLRYLKKIFYNSVAELRMAKLQGMKYREIAEKLNLSEKTIENQMTKAIKMLRTYVAEHGLTLATVVVIILSIIVYCE